MKITISEETKRAHQELSEYNVKFLEFAEKNPESFKKSNFPIISSPVSHGWDENMQPWPIFFNEDIKKRVNRVSTSVFNLIKSIPQRIFSNNLVKMNEYFGFPLPIMQYFFSGLDHNHIPHLLGRGDFIFSPQGIKCVEYNTNSGAEGWVDRLWEGNYFKNPIIAKFIKENHVKIKNEDMLMILFNHLINASFDELSHQHHHKQNELNMIIAIHKYSYTHTRDFQTQNLYTKELYQNILKQYHPGLKGKLEYCDFQHLVFDGEHVTYQGLKVHTILDYSGLYIPINLAIAAKNRKVLIYNGTASGLLSNKLCLAILSENENSHLFTEEERNTIKKHIPWTRKVSNRETTFQGKSINLEDFILSNRENLVLKPATGAGGSEVMLGAKATDNQWQERVNAVLHPKDKHWQNLEKTTNIRDFQKFATDLYQTAHQHNHWVVQEKQESLPYLFQSGENGCDVHNAVWGFFMFGSTYAGAFVRVLPKDNSKGVINTSQGATQSPVFQVEE